MSLCLALPSTAAQPSGPPALGEPHFVAYGAGAIPRGVVSAMAEDRAGFLWVGTGNGLVRYDGYRFRPQEREADDPVQRNLGWTRALLAASDGKVWIGTEADGLAVYDPQQDRVRRLALGEAGAAPPSSTPPVVALAEDLDGSIWLASQGFGLTRLEPASQRITRYRQADPINPLPDDRVLALLVDRHGNLWLGGCHGLSRRRLGSSAFEPVFASGAGGLAQGAVQSLFEAADGRIWAGTQEGELLRVDPASAQVQRLSPPHVAGTEPASAVTRMVQAASGPVWVGHSSGIDVYDVEHGRHLQRLRHDPSRPHGLAGNEVTSLLVDRAGWIWVGGLGLGLQRHNPHDTGLRVREGDADPRSALHDPSLRHLLQLDNSDIWVAPQSGPDVAVLDADLRATGSLHLPADTIPTASSRGPQGSTPARTPPVRAMAQVRDGSVWLAAGARLLQFDRQRRFVRTVAQTAGQTHRLVAASDGGLWVCTSYGLYHLAAGASLAQHLPREGGQPVASDVYGLVEAADGSAWVASGSGLFRVAAGGRTLLGVAAEPGHGLASPNIIGLLVDRQGRLWLDTAVAGLHRMTHWDGRQARFDRISLRHGFVGPPFGSNLLQDGRGRIWTQQHVYDPQSDRLHELGPADGKLADTGWYRAYARTLDGRFLFGGSRGLLVVSPERFEIPTQAPPLVVLELRVNGQQRNAGPGLSAIELQPQDRSFSVEFAALDYEGPGRMRYAYQLQGFDPEWIETGAEQRLASYSNLDPGKYLLRVRAASRGGSWSGQEIAIRLSVLPAWWQQAWARVALVLALGAALWAVVQLRTRQLRRGQQALEIKVQERTASLQQLTQQLQVESAALQESSLTDPLTGLRNRRYLSQHIGAEVDLAIRRNGKRHNQAVPPDDADLVFFLFDIDHFKQVNDLHGHAAGDAVLRQIRGRLEGVFRQADHIVRWGGEEFLVVARGSNRAHASVLAERALRAVSSQPFELADGGLLQRTCSLGFACFPLSTQHPRALDWTETVNLADAALYAAKERGRNAWVGVLDAGAMDAHTLHHERPVSRWLQRGGLTVQRS